jgi:UDP-2,3-diacylglucosamine hydrolase
MPAMPWVFVSDLHFGANYSKSHPNREQLFCEFLRGWEGRAEAVWILGDLFEFWMEYELVIPKHHFHVLHALRKLVDSGVQVHYLCGNHDFNLGTFFQKALGLHIHPGPVTIQVQGLQCHLLHGDGLAASDWRYRITKHILRHPLANQLFKWIHPDWGMGLANYSSKLSRDSHGNRPRFMDEYETAGKALLAQGYDVVMHGHTHCGFVKTLSEGLYINSGEWLERLEYLVLQNGQFTLHDYREHPSRN